MYKILLSRVSLKVFSLIRDLPTYQGALDALKRQYLWLVNTVYARHCLATQQQRPGESSGQVLRALQTLVRACDCKGLTMEQHSELLVRDTFVTGIRKSATGTTLPAWLTSPGPALLRKHVRGNKYFLLVERVHLLHANPQHAYVVLPDGREDMASIRDLAPAGTADHYPEHSIVTMNPVPEVTPRTPSPTQTPHNTPIPGISHAHIPGASLTHEGSLTPSGLTPPVRPEPAQPPSPVQSPPAPVKSQPVLRRSQRQIRPPDRLKL
ncbi:histone acetyltransferase p300-like isoform X2 [Hypanus sabinus]|uniref:histone acetyltransferase p300-like isoform X2 n=1 Tax=Hypanus sabinus TaxID=79690 RepID=UPI0028C435FE|nr:histone acetyltransferase p300-like isoform X2 [Hypanus sabinus]